MARQKKTMKDFTWRVGVKVGAIALAIGAGYGYLASRYTVGLDTQTYRCLDQWVFVIDTWRKPRADEVERGQLVAVKMSVAQTPRDALWSPGQVMVKRALATSAGDVVNVSRAGVVFHHGNEEWTHGTALEAAAQLGYAPEAFERQILLQPGEIFLMGDNPMSYDGRYYGTTDEAQIVGTVLWAF